MKALILVDIQHDFLPGGSLEVPEGDKVIPVANRLSPHFPLVVATQDWHPKNHISFASNHREKKPFEQIELNGMKQTLWPDHCVQGSQGADFPKELETRPVEAIFRKGTNPEIDSYSGFFDNNHEKKTGLGDYLKGRDVDEVYLVGLAADVCVKFTGLDARQLGFRTKVVRDGTYGIEDTEGAFEELRKKGVELVTGDEVLSEVRRRPPVTRSTHRSY